MSKHINIFAFLTIPKLWKVAGCWNSLSIMTRMFVSYAIIIMAADELVILKARASAATVST